MAEFLSHNGSPHNLLVYKTANYVSLVTEFFVKRYIDSKSRTTDQMQQAARSCKQNIVEGCEASMTSKETEIKLTNVARASLSELHEDYLDYLHFRGMEPWSKEHPRILKMRAFIRTSDFASQLPDLLPRLNAEEMCNLAITRIKQTQYLLDRLLQSQQQRFLQQGGIRERMSRARRNYRENKSEQSE